jgi:hypothetical protein
MLAGALPDSGEIASQFPLKVAASAFQASAPPPAFSMRSDWAGGAVPPATTWKLRLEG